MDIRRVWCAQLVCPRCDREHYFEAIVPIDILPPEKLGLGALCGNCHAMRQCYLAGDGKQRPFWHANEEARAWGRIRHNTSKYQMQVFEVDPHNEPLRDDQKTEMLRLIAKPAEKKGYAPILRLIWTMEMMAAKGINWPIPPATEEF